MALGDGGLDAQVEQRMDAYRSNPQQLQQRYGQNRELLDLLALQKLTSEKKAVAADMQMKAQQNPNTIAQQREQEALELTKQEMGGTLGELAGRTKGTLDQKQMQQQQNMGKLAQNASRPQPGPGAGLAGLMGGGARPPARPPVNPQAAGLANARMVQAARGGPIKMAQGGIVAFAQGDRVSRPGYILGVSPEEIAAYRANLQSSALGRGRNTTTALTDEAIARQINAAQEQTALTSRADSAAIARTNIDKLSDSERRVLSRTGNAPNDMLSRVATVGSPLEIPQEGIGALLPPSMPQPTAEPPARTPMGAILPSIETPAEPPAEPPAESAEGATTPPADTSTSAPQSSGGVDMNTLMGNMGFSAEDPNAALQRGFTEADAYTGRAEKAAKYDDMIAEIAEFDAENYDPDRERRDRLKSFLMGAAGTTNIGTTFASAGAASMNLANSQRKARRSRLMDKFNMEKDKMTTDTGLAQSGLTLGRELYSQAQQNQRSALQAGVQMRGQDLENAQKNADRLLRKVEGDNTQAYRAATIALEENKLDLATLKEENATEAARVTAANNTIFRTLQVREQISAEANALAGVEVAQTELENAELMGLEPAQIKALQEKFDKAAALALVMTEDMMNKFGRGTDKDGKPTGTSLLDAEQFAIQVLGQYGIAPTIGKDSVTSRTYDE